MIEIKEVIITEGKYDKIKLDSIVKANIITTSGFSVFRDAQKRKLIRTLAEKCGLLILTDSDSAGFLIRNHLNGLVPKSLIKHAFIPLVEGKEKRKPARSKEGLLGVEGVSSEMILKAIQNAGATIIGENKGTAADAVEITKSDLFAYGLSGATDSAKKRKELCKRLDIPEKISANMLLSVINVLFTVEEWKEFITRLSF